MTHPLNEIIAQPLQRIAANLAEALSAADIAAILGPEATRALGQRSRLGCLRLALTADVLHTIRWLPHTSSGGRFRFLAPFLLAAGRLFGETLPHYQRFASLTRAQVGEFYTTWMAEVGPFGGQYTGTMHASHRLARVAAQFACFGPLADVHTLFDSLIDVVLAQASSAPDPIADQEAAARIRQAIQVVVREPRVPPPLLLEVEPHPPQRITTGKLGKPTCCRFDPSRPRLAIGTESGAVFVVELPEGSVPFGVHLHETPAVVDVVLVRNTEMLVVASEDQKIRLFNLEDGLRWWSRETFDEVQQLLPLTFPEGPGVLIGADARGLVIPLDFENPPGRRATWRLQAFSPRRMLTRAIFSTDPDENLFAAIEEPGTSDGHEDIRLLDRSSRRVCTLIGHDDVVGATAFSPWGRLLASVSYDGSIRLWDTTTGQERSAWKFGPEYRFTSVAFSPDGRLLYVGSAERTDDEFGDPRPSLHKGVLLLDVATGEVIRRLCTPHPVERLTLSPDGRFLALLGDEEAVLLWDLHHGAGDTHEAERLRPHRSEGSLIGEVTYDPEAIRALVDAARAGDLDQVKVALAGGLDVNESSITGETALHAAAGEGHLPLVEYLLDQGADSLRLNERGHGPRWLALANGHREVAELFRARGETWQDEHQLLEAIGSDDPEVVRALLAAGADPDGREHATLPALGGNRMSVETATPLTQAAFHGEEGLLELLLDAGADPDRRDGVPLSPWGAAMHGGQTSAAAYLVLRGASPDPGRSLLEAIRLRNAAAVDRLLAADLDVNELVEQPDGPRTPFQVALTERAGDFALRLLHAGAVPTSPGQEVAAVLREALACLERLPLLRELLARGLDVNAVDSQRRSLLANLLAEPAEEDTFDVAALLLQSGAQVDARDALGQTPLHLLANQHETDPEVAALLLAFGADPEARDSRERTPLRLARRKGNPSVLAILGDRRGRLVWARRLRTPRTCDDFAFRGRIRMAAARWSDAIADYEQAIRLDPARSDPAVTNWYDARATASEALGNSAPRQALWHYGFGYQSSLQSVRVAHYRVAYRIDELFWWAANNLAWEVATTPWLNQRDGELALQFAVEVDRRSEGRCWSFLDTLAAAHAAAGDFERAVAVAERALTLAPAEEQELIQHNLDRYRVGQGWDDPDRAPVPPAPVPDEPLSEPERLLRQGKYQQALELARDEMAAGSPTLDQQITLGRVLLAWERETEAQQHLERARGQLEHQSEQSSRHIRVLLDLAYLRSLQGDQDGALALLESAEAMVQQVLPQADSLRGDLLAERAFVHLAKSDAARAKGTLLTALAFCADHLPENHETTARCLLALSQLAVQQRRPEQALSRLGDALAIGEQHLSLQHPFLAKALALATNLLLELGFGSRALPLALQGRETISTVLGSGHPRTWELDDLFERALAAANT